ncbi:penicillin-insensitive murein endopeptidase (plasmid) [Pseudorhodobacter turbinis]|uniref:Penicillin-insensitive murein endopeptidase n=1 Tax=Pseudorhodobacter turbinis TaxID=2500533 RepID=A0A4P8EKF2_9RHOB|nr:penicillin-insensitive murein endopeptidase [Pseudorhodobacter turbinis]QCO57508.1 penicillin-insensitive murein endopeptidase [Pseudorhodobacter turbinis]
MLKPFILGLLLTAVAAPVQAEPLANRLFGAEKTASRQAAMPVGSYAKGCAAGQVQLPENGPTWQAMRLSRDRHWGQPVMIDYLQDLSRMAVKVGWKGLYIGDIAQPRGGPMTSGHASHQIGLDADVWMRPPSRLNLSRSEREKIGSIPVRSKNQRSVTKNWTRSHHALLKAAASDRRVDRIFVAAAVKLEMCKTARRSDKRWLQKIRPVAGHDTHFHVRLKCPRGASACVTQKPTVSSLSKGGNGCDATLRWWVTDYLNPPKAAPKPKKPKKKTAPRKRPRQFTMADLPNQCKNVLNAR